MGITAPPSKEDSKQQTPKADLQPTLGQQFSWEDQFRKDAVAQIQKWSDDLNISVFTLESFVRDNIDGAINYINSRRPTSQAKFDIEEGVGRLEPRSHEAIGLQDYEKMWYDGLVYFSLQSGINFVQPRPKGGSGSGRRKPSAQDIRNQFDIEELTKGVEDMWGAYLVADAPNARQIAKNYVDTIVASGGEVALDFKTFVLNQMERTPRWDLLYKSKPEGVDPLEYINKYRQAAQQVISGGDRQRLGNAVAAGARLGANPEQFAGRLRQEREVTGSQGFVTGLEDRMRSVKNILRG